MTLLGWFVLIAIIGGAAWMQYIISKDIQGPSHCMGCGKCDKTGVCILTGKPIGPRRKQ